ncbi:MAG: peptidyl-prolyl cis-trans isomerase [Treponemataceae bacterium]
MKHAITLGIFFVFVAAFTSAQSDLQPLATVKIGKPETITLKQLKTRVEGYQRQTGSALTVPQKIEVLDALINEKLVTQAAEKARIIVTDSEVNQAFIQFISQSLGRAVTEQQFASLIKEQTGQSVDEFLRAQVGMNLSDYKANVRSTLLVQRYVASLKQKELSSSQPSDKEIRDYYELNKTSIVQPDVIKLFALAVKKDKDADAAKKQIATMQSDLKNKKTTVSELALKSKDPNSNFVTGEQFIPKAEISAQQLGIGYNELLALFTRPINEVSDVTETAENFQLHIVLAKENAKMLALSDLVQPGTTVTVYEYIRSNLGQQKQNQILAESLKEISESLRSPDNYKMEKTGAALEKFLTW